MEFKLTIYKDESLQEVKRIAEADSLKIPYRTSLNLINMLASIDGEEGEDVLGAIRRTPECLNKILKATFGLTETELDGVNAAELIDVVKGLMAWCIAQLRGMHKPKKQ